MIVTLDRMREIARDACDSGYWRHWASVGIRVQDGVCGAVVGEPYVYVSQRGDAGPTGEMLAGISAWEVNVLATASDVGCDWPGNTILILGTDDEVAEGEEAGEITMTRPTVLDILEV